MARLAGPDSTLQKGVAAFFGEAFFNIVRMICDSAKTLPIVGDGSPHVRVTVELSEAQMEQDQVPAGRRVRPR